MTPRSPGALAPAPLFSFSPLPYIHGPKDPYSLTPIPFPSSLLRRVTPLFLYPDRPGWVSLCLDNAVPPGGLDAPPQNNNPQARAGLGASQPEKKISLIRPCFQVKEG